VTAVLIVACTISCKTKPEEHVVHYLTANEVVHHGCNENGRNDSSNLRGIQYPYAFGRAG
jgi:hypothetical protein